MESSATILKFFFCFFTFFFHWNFIITHKEQKLSIITFKTSCLRRVWREAASEERFNLYIVALHQVALRASVADSDNGLKGVKEEERPWKGVTLGEVKLDRKTKGREGEKRGEKKFLLLSRVTRAVMEHPSGQTTSLLLLLLPSSLSLPTALY